MKYLFLTILLLSSLVALDFSISNSTITNGRTVYVEFAKNKNINYEKLLISNKSYQIFNHPNDDKKMYSLLPVSYYQKPSDKKVNIIYKQNGKTKIKTLFLKIKDGAYKKEKITVQKSKVNPISREVKARIAKEYAQAMKLYATSTSKSYITSKFIIPINSKITSDFGKARVYNNSLKGYHSGTDYRAKIGTPIVASNDGIVVLVKKRFYSGGTVILDHGHGIYTCYYHMSKASVKEGQKIKKDDILGLSGDTGRVTGPHLHFSARVGGVQVDPLQLIELLNKKLF